jgi:hypothetical protein
VTALFLFALLNPAAAGTESCSVWMVVNDPDPKGQNVRSEPKGTATVLGQFPGGTEITAIAAKDGWIQFKDPIAFEPDKGREWEPRTEGPQTGWLHAALLQTSLRDRWINEEKTSYFAVYPKPDATAKPLVEWKQGDPYSPGNDWDAVQTILDCHKGWLKAKIKDPKKPKTTHTGWIHPDNQCPNQVTTCP